MSDTRAEKYAVQLSRLISHETISAKGATDLSKFFAFHEVLREQFPSLFSVCEVEKHNGSILLRWRGKDGSLLPILLMNHHDVVEATGDWTYPPFSGTIADGKVWGRGTLDTKGGLWAMLCAADELAADGYAPDCDVYFLSTCCEETTGKDADEISRSFAERGIRFSMVLDEGGMILDEPMSGVRAKYAMIGVGEKGCADLKFTARSHGGHASTPPKNSPLVRLGKFMAAVEKSNIFKVKMSAAVRATLKSLSCSMKGGIKPVLSHPRLFSPILCKVMPSISPTSAAMLKTTLAFTMAHGSEGYNVLPREAYVTGNMRYSHHQGGKNSINAVKRLAAKYDIEVEVVDGGFDSTLSDHNGAAFKLIQNAVNEIFDGVKSAPYVMNAATDSRYMSRVCDQCLRFAPFAISNSQLASVHAVDENIDVSALAPAVDFYRYVIKGAGVALKNQ